MNQTGSITSSQINSKRAEGVEELSLEQATHAMVTESLGRIKGNIKDENEFLSKRSELIDFMRKFNRALNNAADEDGNIDLSKMQEFLDKAEEFQETALKLEEEADQLELKAKELEKSENPADIRESKELTQQVKRLRLHAKELMEVYRHISSKNDVETLSKDEKGSFLQSGRDIIDDYTRLNNRQAQIVRSLSDELTMVMKMATDMIRSLKESSMAFARGARSA